MIDRHRGRQREPAVDLLLAGALHQLVEKAAHLAHVARRLRQSLLAGVELLEHGHRNVDVVLFEAEDRGRIVHQHIRVQHEYAAPCLAWRLFAAAAPGGRALPVTVLFTAANTAAA